MSDALHRDAPDVAALVPDVAGVLGIVLPEGQVVLWVRDEVLRHVDWGGDPYNKEIARGEDDSVRLSPRKSFERWREVVRGHSVPWTSDQTDVATSAAWPSSRPSTCAAVRRCGRRRSSSGASCPRSCPTSRGGRCSRAQSRLARVSWAATGTTRSCCRPGASRSSWAT